MKKIECPKFIHQMDEDLSIKAHRVGFCRFRNLFYMFCRDNLWVLLRARLRSFGCFGLFNSNILNKSTCC